MFSYFVCPKCGRRTEEMELLKQVKYIPTERQEKERPYMEHIKHEVLFCSCKKLNNWFDLKEIKNV